MPPRHGAPPPDNQIFERAGSAHITKITVEGDVAFVALSDGQSVELRRRDDHWGLQTLSDGHLPGG